MLIAVIGAQALDSPGSAFGASESPACSHRSMVSGNPLLWEISPTAPTVTLQSMWDSPFHTMTTSYTDDSPQSALSSSPSDRDTFSQSTHSPYMGVLRQLMATPSPGTAAAMVCTPPVSSGQLMETQGPDSNAAVQKTPLASSSRKSVRTLCCKAAAALVCSPSLLSEQSTSLCVA